MAGFRTIQLQLHPPTMFKSILPSRRAPSGDFTIITNLIDGAGKENQPAQAGQPQIAATKGRIAPKQTNEKKKKLDVKKSKDSPVNETFESAQAFDKLLVCSIMLTASGVDLVLQDDLQIPSGLRPKLYGMDSSVKAAMLKSSQTMAIAPAPEPSPPSTPRSKNGLRRAHSSDSLNTPRHPTLASLAADDSGELPYPGISAAHVSAHQSPYLSSPQRKASGHARGMSFDGTRLFSKSQVNLVASSSTLDLTAGGAGKASKGAVTKNLSPTKFCSLLTSTSSTQLDVEDLKKLRLLLRNESAW